MARASRKQPLLPAAPVPVRESLRHLLTTTWAGRALLLGLTFKLLALMVRQAAGAESGFVQLLDRVGTIALLLAGAYFLYRIAALARRRLLWRVRRKLILSYIFIGFVPALLIVAFFVLAGLLLFFNLSSYLVQSRLRSLTEQAQFLARTAALEIQRARGAESPQAILARRQASAESRYPGASMALVPTGQPPCTQESTATAAGAVPSSGGVGGAKAPPSASVSSAASASSAPSASAGPWSHLEPPLALPPWVSCSGFGGILAYEIPAETRAERGGRQTDPSRTRPTIRVDLTDPDSDIDLSGEHTRLVIRAAALPEGPAPSYAVILDLPVNDIATARLREETGIELSRISATRREDKDRGLTVKPARGRRIVAEARQERSGPAAAGNLLTWVSILDYIDWDNGESAYATASIGMKVSEVYDRLSSAQTRIRNRITLGQFLLFALLLIAVLFLLIEFFALIMGFALAKSITGSVHALFVGTEKVRQGDFTHKIEIKARDQLGELADSFNSMTASIEELLRQAAEKKRLEEELRIAREIQMSLLPHGPLAFRGLSVTALCVPAREVGGDYYDFLPLDDQRLGVLIADVSGKGTSAALYMAELKGLVLSLSQIHRSPRQLLINANRIIADNLDNRSFITMTYAVIDLRARTMTYARAGHTPLIHLPADGAVRQAQILTPDGLVLGLNIDRGEKFEALLEEATIQLRSGDLFLLFTDGISEAMNEASDCFGESRLGQLIEQHGHLPCDELRERILREIETFVGGAAQHDDMTMILLKIEPEVREATETDVHHRGTETRRTTV